MTISALKQGLEDIDSVPPGKLGLEAHPASASVDPVEQFPSRRRSGAARICSGNSNAIVLWVPKIYSRV